MSYKVIMGGVGQARDKAPQGVRPTVLIGLGGTGGDVLLKVRKKIYERYGTPSDFPVLQYIYIDTDTSNKDIDSTLLNEFDFTKGERIDAVVPDTAKYTRHMSQYPLLKTWWYPTMADPGSLTVGAGQIRSYSRLGFYVNFDKIKNAISTALGASIQSSDTMFKRWGIQIDPNGGMNVYIVTSTAGGTGSGMFLDTAFLCKTLLAGQGNQIIGVLILPGIFSSHVERLFANGYSALKELEHYTYSSNAFDYEWVDGYPPRDNRPIPAPPFGYCYIVDNTNFVRQQLGFSNKQTLFEMVANSIFQDFGSSEFAAHKRSTRVNLDFHLTGFYAADILDPRDPSQKLLSEVFTMNHSAFGLASIQYPADRIKRALGAKLAADIMRRLAQGEPPKGEFGKWVRETFFKGGYEESQFEFFIGDVTLNDGRRVHRHDILDALYKTSKPGAKIDSVIEEQVDKLQNDVSAGVYKLNRIPLSQFLRSQEEQILINVRDEPSNNPDKWGDWCKWLRRNKQDFLTQQIFGSVNSLNQKTPSHLETAIGIFVNKPDLGLAFAKDLLREIRTTLTHEAYPYLPRFRREAEELTSVVQKCSQEYKRNWSEIQKRETERGIAARIFGGTDTEHLVGEYIKNFRQYLLAVVKLRARREAIEICEETLKVIGEEGVIEDKTGKRVGDSGMLRSLIQLEGALKDLAAEFERIQQEYSKKDEDQNTLYIYEPAEIDNSYYRHYMGRTPVELHAKISTHAQELLDCLPSPSDPNHSGVRVMELPYFVALNGHKQATKLILQYCDAVFKMLHDDFEVLELFYDMFPDSTARFQQLRQLYAKAQIWIEGTSQSGYHLPITNRQIIIGYYKNPRSSRGAEFEFEVKKARGPDDPEIWFNQTSTKNEIIFYSEGAGYPLCYLKAVHDMKIRYEKMAFDELVNLHADRNEYKFKDLLEMTERDREELEMATRTFLLGIILDIIKASVDSEDETVYKVMQKIGLNASECAIGTRHRAVGVLRQSNRRALRDQLDNLIRERESQLKAGDDGWAKYYAVVSYYEERVFPSISIEQVSKEYKFQATTENLVLRRKLKEIEAAAGDLDALEAIGRPIHENLVKGLPENAVIMLPDKMVAIRHAWAKAAAVRL
jgi:hypothetical protein